MEQLLELDKNVFIFLNGLGSVPFDHFWLLLTKQINWALFFLLVFFILQRRVGYKRLGIIILFLAALITFTDQATNLVKNSVQRLRPCSTPELMDVIRIVKSSATYSFFSGHASNSMASTLFIFLIIRKFYNYTYLLFLFPLLFAYSRIYLGLHYPGDILVGYLFGIFSGTIFYKLYQLFDKKYTTKIEVVS